MRKCFFVLFFFFCIVALAAEQKQIQTNAKSCQKVFESLSTSHNPSHHRDPSAVPPFITQLSIDDPTWVVTNVRIPGPKGSLGFSRIQFRTYLENVFAAEKYFDQSFRSGLTSPNLSEVLATAHRLLILGQDQRNPYPGVTIQDDTRLMISLNMAGRFSNHPANPFKGAGTTVTLVNYSLDPNREWDGSGPPPDLTGPFPATNEEWTVEIPEVRQVWIEKMGNRPAASLLPFNRNLGSSVRHYYPVDTFVPIYGMALSRIMDKIEKAVFHPNEGGTVHDFLTLIADYYRVAINGLLFYKGNNSLFMMQTNYFLNYLGLHGIPHGGLDFFAYYKDREQFRQIFIDAVLRSNPELKGQL